MYFCYWSFVLSWKHIFQNTLLSVDFVVWLSVQMFFFLRSSIMSPFIASRFPDFTMEIPWIVFIYFWLRWVFTVLRLALFAASGWGTEGSYSSSQRTSFSLQRRLLWSTGSRHAGSVVVVHGLGCSPTCERFPDQESNLCPLHWQVDSYPLYHQGSPLIIWLCMYSV